MLLYTHPENPSLSDEYALAKIGEQEVGFSYSVLAEATKKALPEFGRLSSITPEWPSQFMKDCVAAYAFLHHYGFADNFFDPVMLAATVLREHCKYVSFSASSPALANSSPFEGEGGFLSLLPANNDKQYKRTGLVKAYGLLSWQDADNSGLQTLADKLNMDRFQLASWFPYIPVFLQIIFAQITIKTAAAQVRPEPDSSPVRPPDISKINEILSLSTYGWKIASPEIQLLNRERNNRGKSAFAVQSIYDGIQAYYLPSFKHYLKGSAIKFFISGRYEKKQPPDYSEFSRFLSFEEFAGTEMTQTSANDFSEEVLQFMSSYDQESPLSDLEDDEINGFSIRRSSRVLRSWDSRRSSRIDHGYPLYGNFSYN